MLKITLIITSFFLLSQNFCIAADEAHDDEVNGGVSDYGELSPAEDHLADPQFNCGYYLGVAACSMLGFMPLGYGGYRLVYLSENCPPPPDVIYDRWCEQGLEPALLSTAIGGTVAGVICLAGCCLRNIQNCLKACCERYLASSPNSLDEAPIEIETAEP